MRVNNNEVKKYISISNLVNKHPEYMIVVAIIFYLIIKSIFNGNVLFIEKSTFFMFLGDIINTVILAVIPYSVAIMSVKGVILKELKASSRLFNSFVYFFLLLIFILFDKLIDFYTNKLEESFIVYVINYILALIELVFYISLISLIIINIIMVIMIIIDNFFKNYRFVDFEEEYFNLEKLKIHSFWFNHPEDKKRYLVDIFLNKENQIFFKVYDSDMIPLHYIYGYKMNGNIKLTEKN